MPEPDRFRALAAEFLEGELDPTGLAELERILAAEPDKARLLVDLYRQGRVLRAALEAPADQLFARRVLRELEADRSPFVRQVMREVQAAGGARRGGTAPFVLAAAAVLLVAGALLAVGGRPPLAAVEVAGPGMIIERGGAPGPATAGSPLFDGDVLRTTRAGGGRLRYRGEPTELTVEPHSELTLRATAGGKRIWLARGELHADVAPQPPGRPLVIESPFAAAEVLGTRLKLSAVPDATRLEVHSGRVRLVRDGHAVEVPARHYTIAAPDDRMEVQPISPLGDVRPLVASFSLVEADGERGPLPGFERLEDGAVINLARLPTRRINLRANTVPERVGSLVFALDDDEHHNIELVWPYVIVPATKREKRPWNPPLGRHVVTATPYTGTYCNGTEGIPLSITLTFVDEP